MNPKKCYIYCRTNKHAHEPQHAGQLERLQRYADRLGMEIIDEFQDFVDSENPQLQGLAELLLSLKHIGEPIALLVTTPDRLGGDPGNIFGMIRFLSHEQCSIYTPYLGRVEWKGRKGLVSVEKDSMEGRR